MILLVQQQQQNLYNGTSWTTVTFINILQEYNTAGFGIQTAAILAGGNTGSSSSATEIWDGTSWANSPAELGTARGSLANNGAGTTTAGVVSGGGSPGNATEEWSAGNATTKTLTTS
jgi:hypothetical protein